MKSGTFAICLLSLGVLLAGCSLSKPAETTALGGGWGKVDIEQVALEKNSTVTLAK